MHSSSSSCSCGRKCTVHSVYTPDFFSDIFLLSLLSDVRTFMGREVHLPWGQKFFSQPKARAKSILTSQQLEVSLTSFSHTLSFTLALNFCCLLLWKCVVTHKTTKKHAPAWIYITNMLSQLPNYFVITHSTLKCLYLKLEALITVTSASYARRARNNSRQDTVTVYGGRQEKSYKGILNIREKFFSSWWRTKIRHAWCMFSFDLLSFSIREKQRNQTISMKIKKVFFFDRLRRRLQQDHGIPSLSMTFSGILRGTREALVSQSMSSSIPCLVIVSDFISGWSSRASRPWSKIYRQILSRFSICMFFFFLLTDKRKIAQVSFFFSCMRKMRKTGKEGQRERERERETGVSMNWLRDFSHLPSFPVDHTPDSFHAENMSRSTCLHLTVILDIHTKTAGKISAVSVYYPWDSLFFSL